MAKFVICAPNGDVLYEGCPTFTGQYMKPGIVEFREISSPVPLPLEPGCYIGWRWSPSQQPVKGYYRTGFRYKLYTVPQVKKQARINSYGAAFVYQNVQFFDASKDLEFCPFRDLVTGDNRIHFSTQPSISTFEPLSGIAARLQACLEDQYGEGSWEVRVAENANPIVLEAREFTVSGLNLLECLNKVYEIWPETGWELREEINGNTIKDIIIIGAGASDNNGEYLYGKGRGLKSITRNVANADELANRIFAYGSQRNMMSDWYRRQPIQNAESVDIKHLMIPVAHWIDADAAKAYVQDDDSIARLGLRPATYYFDGTGDLPEIYPTIEGMTIGNVRGLNVDYLPDPLVWDDDAVRVDEVEAASPFTDDGYAGEQGSSRLQNNYWQVDSQSSGGVIFSGVTTKEFQFFYQTAEPGEGVLEVQARVDFGGSITVEGVRSGYVSVTLEMVSSPTGGEGEEGEEEEIDNLILAEDRFDIQEATTGVWMFLGGGVSLGKTSFSENDVLALRAKLVLVLDPTEDEEEPGDGDKYYQLHVNTGGTASLSTRAYRDKTFHLTLRQLGFDIGERAALGEGMTISMRSGKCQGRSFTIKECTYVAETDTWDLECYRSEDESLGQWFPNATYPISGPTENDPGDRFVLLDIAMPDSYILYAETRLYNAAQELLEDTATERWQYIPEIDAKFMVENNRSIYAGMNMIIIDPDIVSGTEEYVTYLQTDQGETLVTAAGEQIILDDGGYLYKTLVDTIVINEGEAAIPTYKVTLRDRKKKTFTEAVSVSEISAHSVADHQEVKTTRISGTSAFFEYDENTNSVKLKDEFNGLWAKGWMAAGGVAGDGDTPGGDTPGGGGGTTVWWGNEVPGKTVQLYVGNELPKTLLLDGALDALEAQVNGYNDTINNLFQIYNTINGWLDELDRLEVMDWFVVTTVNGVKTLKLNTQYAGLWAEGWISSGGVGSGGGGGASYLYQLLDVSLPTPPSNPGNGDLLSWNGTVWTNIPQSSVRPNLTSIESRLTSLENTVSAHTTQIATITGILDTVDWFVDETYTEGNVTKHRLKLNTKYDGMYAMGWVSAGGVGQGGGSIVVPKATDQEVGGILAGYLHSTTPSINPVSSTSGRYYYVEVDSTGLAFVNVPWTSGGGGGGTGTVTGVTVGSTPYTPDTDGIVTLPAYPTTLPASDVYSWAKASSKPSYSLSEISGTSDLQAIEALSGTSGLLKKTGANTWTLDTTTYLSSHQTIYALTFEAGTFEAGTYTPNSAAKTIKIPTTLDNISDGSSRKLSDYVTLATTQNNISGTKTFTATNLYAKNFLPSTGSSYNLGSSSARWATLYAVDANLSGDLSADDASLSGNLTLTSSKHIDIGPVRLEFANGGLHVTTNDPTNYPQMGLYADGWVSAGGIGTNSSYEFTSNKVTTLSSSSTDV